MVDRLAELRDLIRRNRVLAHLDDAAIERMALGAERRTLSPSETLYSRGDAAEWLFLVLSGSVELLLDDDSGNRTRIEMVAAPQPIGLVCALDGGAYAYNCEGGPAGANLLALPAAAFAAALPENPLVVRMLLADASARLRRLLGQLSDLKLRDSVQRLAGYLVELTPVQSGSADLILPSEKRLVADQLGMKPETLSRALARLQEMGLAHPADAATLRVPDLGGLRHIYLAGGREFAL